MKRSKSDQIQQSIGLAISFAVHVTGAIISIAVLQHSQATASKAPEIFTVTLEGGEVLGGAAQVPKPGKESEPLPKGATPEEVIEKAPEVETQKEEPQAKEEPASKTEPEPPVEVEKKLEEPSVVPDPEKLMLEQKKLEEEKKIAEEKKKQDEEKKKKQLEDKKKKEDLEKKKAKDELEAKLKAKKDKEQAKKNRDKRRSELARQIKSKSYDGESANVGGEGFGAAKLGGKGGGGGTLGSLEMVAYANQLQEHVKSGWRWTTSSDKYRCLVRVRITPAGEITDVRVETSSGNQNFDDSVVRAVRKASPAPKPPENYYDHFKDVRFWFDSHE